MKKKICLISIIGLALLSGCSKGYKEGVYTGTAIDSYGGQNNTATAIVTVYKRWRRNNKKNTRRRLWNVW